jgi:hypothetical protein
MLDLELDLPTTAEDVEALRNARGFAILDLDSYLRFLAQLPELAVADLRVKRGPRGDRPFELAR